MKMGYMRGEKSEWEKLNCIGRGCYGTVNMAVNKSDGQKFAVKSVDLRSCLPAQSEALENEIKILRSIFSPFVVKYLDDGVTLENGVASFRNLHMEYMPGGTAADVAKNEETLRSRVYCILAGLSDVHSAGIVHCDIKGRNVLIGSSPSVAKLADFGSATFVTSPSVAKHANFDSAIFATAPTTGPLVPRGSPFWMAPEVVRGEYHGPESDIWSLGCTVIEMMTGQPPWKDYGPKTLLQIGYSDELPGLLAEISELGKDFLNKCLRRDRAERWTCDQLLRHPFVKSSEPLNHMKYLSPRCVLDWTSSEFSDNDEENYQTRFDFESVRGRITELATNEEPIWESDGWVEVRNVMSDETEQEVGTSSEYSDSLGAEVDINNSNFGDGAEVETNFSWISGTRGFTAGGNYICKLINFDSNKLYLNVVYNNKNVTVVVQILFEISIKPCDDVA